MDETARLQYIRPLPLYEKERPYYIFPDIPSGFTRSNLEYEFGPEQLIADVRGRESEFTLEEYGFTYRAWTPPQLDWEDEQEIVAKYMPGVKALLSEVLGIGDTFKRCEVFDWRLRNVTSNKELANPAGDRMVKIRGAPVVHVDQSPAGALDRMHRQLGDDADDLIMKYRARIFNVWRPLVDVVEDSPITVCDARTPSRSDFVEIEIINKDFVRRSFMLKYNENFRFYYLSRMTKNEVCVFKVFDSADLKNPGVPHSAFQHKSPGSAPPRESIEVRLLILSEY